MDSHFLSVENPLDPQLNGNISQGRLINSIIQNGQNVEVRNIDPEQQDQSKKGVISKVNDFGIGSTETELNPSHSMLSSGQNFGEHYGINTLPDGEIYGQQLSNSHNMNELDLQEQNHQDVVHGTSDEQKIAKDTVFQAHLPKRDILVSPIPPLHVQQQIVNKNQSFFDNSKKEEDVEYQMLRSSCTRCKKEFDQPLIIPQQNSRKNTSKPLAEPKIFKLCQHCRDLQRKRSRRWQEKTKDKNGACRRCGVEIPIDQQRFVLCPSCRENLRTRKANRAAQGKCVHCSGPLDASIITEGKEKMSDLDKSGSFKVCQRCRENDKIRRMNLEKKGHCNRCAKLLEPEDIGRHKVCLYCRTRKKRSRNNGFQEDQSQSAFKRTEDLGMINDPSMMSQSDQSGINILAAPGFVAPPHQVLPNQYNQNYYQSAPNPIHQHSYINPISQNNAFSQAMELAQAQAQAQVHFPLQTPAPLEPATSNSINVHVEHDQAQDQAGTHPHQSQQQFIQHHV